MSSKLLWGLALLTALFVALAPVKVKSVAVIPDVSHGTSTVSTSTATVVPQTVEDYVRESFKDAPVMLSIAKCESRFRQFDSTGKVLKNPKSSAKGVFQVMESIHATYAKTRLGLDILTLEGNVAYARYLYDKNGTRDWNASKACWG